LEWGKKAGKLHLSGVKLMQFFDQKAGKGMFFIAMKLLIAGHCKGNY
jgi:hypothetical protein